MPNPDDIEIFGFPEPQEPDRENFVQTGNDVFLSTYLFEINFWFNTVQFLGLGVDDDRVREIPIDELFVVPDLSERHVRAEDSRRVRKESPEIFRPALEVLRENRRLVLLGDPGSGKSTFVAWMVHGFCEPLSTPLKSLFGDLIPIPMILKDMRLGDLEPTWDALLETFFRTPMCKGFFEEAKRRKLSEDPEKDLREKLTKALECGQAVVLLDGIDEVGGIPTRKRLRDAVWEGFRRFPRAGFCLTSRLVGYDEAPFHSVQQLFKQLAEDQPTLVKRVHEFYPSWMIGKQGPGELSDSRTSSAHIEEMLELVISEHFKKEVVQGFKGVRTLVADLETSAEIPLLYICPFSDRQRSAFIEQWFQGQISNSKEARQKARDLIERLPDHENIAEITYVPNLLTLACLIFLFRSFLPEGRAELYERISEAYLNGIDRARKLPEPDPFDWRDKERWLAEIAYHMQLQRAEGDEETQRDILIERDELLQLLCQIMGGEEDDAVRRREAEAFVSHVGRRSGLFIPRGEGYYAFTHLSFLEYYTAKHLVNYVDNTRWWKGRLVGQRIPTLEQLKGWSSEPAWEEVFLLLFELCNIKDGVDDTSLREELFAEDDDKPLKLGTLKLLARIALDKSTNLTDAERHAAFRRCWREHEIPRKGDHFIAYLQSNENLARVMTDPGVPEVWPALEELDPSRVTLAFCASIRNEHLCHLAGLTALQHLNLHGTQVSDFAPLAGLTGLQWLDLDRTQVSDLAPLAGLTALQELSLGGTQVSDLAPLAGLTGLQRLDLDSTPVNDLAPLAEFTALQTLYLQETQVSDLAPLSGLTALQKLSLGGTQLSDLAPLSGLTALQELSLGGTQVSDLAPLSGLTGLQWLDLDRTQVSDLAPLAGLTGLQWLDLDETQVTEAQVEEFRRKHPQATIL